MRREVRTAPIRIDAPLDVVWDVLTAVENYGKWNPFTPEARTDFAIGSPARLLVRMGPGSMRITETVCAYERPRLVAWSRAFGARRLLLAVREQHLEPLGESSCRYHNTDRLTGVLAPIVYLCFGGYMRRGFRDVGAGLKRYAEALSAGTSMEGALRTGSSRPGPGRDAAGQRPRGDGGPLGSRPSGTSLTSWCIPATVVTLA